MIELRWVEFGPNKQLEYRTKIYSGRRGMRPATPRTFWSDWVIVPTVSAHEAAMGDLVASGGIQGAP